MTSPAEPLDIGVAQPETLPDDVAGNAQRHGDAVRSARARVVVFPELSLTGYEFDAAPIDPTDSRLAPLVDACAECGSLALVGAPVAAPGQNDRSESTSKNIAILAVDGDGARIGYRKIWLGEAERPHFEPGESPAVLEVDGWRLGLAICRDTGVPAHAEATAALGIDAYLAGVLERLEIATNSHRGPSGSPATTAYGWRLHPLPVPPAKDSQRLRRLGNLATGSNRRCPCRPRTG